MVAKTSPKLQKLIRKNDADTTMNCAIDQQNRSEIWEISFHICCQVSVDDGPNEGKDSLQTLFWSGELLQWLSVLPDLVEVLTSVPSTYNKCLTTAVTPAPRDLVRSSKPFSGTM